MIIAIFSVNPTKMSVTFRHSATSPNSLILNLGRIPKFGEICINVNIAQWQYGSACPCILHSNSPDVLNTPDYFTTEYPVTKDIDLITTCDWIYRACLWYKPYMGGQELTPAPVNCVLKYLDKLSDWIYKACIWYTPYSGRNEFIPVHAHYALQYLDKLSVSIPIPPSHKRIFMINKLKTYWMCDPSSMPLISAKLDMLMEEEAKARLQVHKAKRIQGHWRKVVANPYHVVCQRRLKREFQNMMEAI
jgi:hypothetical protein